MRLVRCPTKCVRRLRAGEARRVPTSLLYLGGYHIGCPSCGRPNSISATQVAFVEEGMDAGETPSLSMEAVTCDRCGVRFDVRRDEVRVVGLAG